MDQNTPTAQEKGINNMTDSTSRFSFWIFLSGILGASAVAIGAIAAHALTNPLAVSSVEKASSYQLWHSLAILVSLFLKGGSPVYARLIFVIGIVLFCGSIYAKYLLGAPGAVVVAPAGGVALMVGWLLLGLGGYQSIK